MKRIFSFSVKTSILLLVIFATTFVACKNSSGGASSGSDVKFPSALAAKGPISSMAPDNGGGLYFDAPLFRIENGNRAKYKNGVYGIEVWPDDTVIQHIALIGGLEEDGNGVVTFSVDGILKEGQKYLWKFTARYEVNGVEASYTSDPAIFTVSTVDGAKPVAPRDNGILDSALALSSKAPFSVKNGFTSDGDNLKVQYDFQVFTDSGLGTLLIEGKVPALDDKRFTTFTDYTASTVLFPGSTYFWRSRAVINDLPLPWRDGNSFTVKSPCEVTGPRYANKVIDFYRARDCPENEFNDPQMALGWPDAKLSVPYSGFVSLDFGGQILFEMGATVVDWPGDDFRVYESVSTEFLEVLVAQTEAGPWVSLGAQLCPDYCDFDLGSAGVPYARFVKIKDLGSLAADCHSTSGSDIDAVLALQPGLGDYCAGGWSEDIYSVYLTSSGDK